ncbi:MAG: hypothetical protein CEE42_03095 [Promethearchaeota archaeon Loki_b31]|nr:MAG: hypothetical protein CEE42_03095 [Candidatus Lokiarchaeota archaeon Loki_b31]
MKNKSLVFWVQESGVEVHPHSKVSEPWMRYDEGIFCYMDAVNAVLDKQKKIEGIFNIEEGFREILNKGATVRLCNLCLLVRGTMKNCLTKECGDVKRAGTPDLAKIIDETDKLIVIC